MKSVLVLLCLGTAFASVEEKPPSSGLYEIKDVHKVAKSTAKGNVFVYYYDGQALTGIPRTSSQRSGTRIQAAVLVYPRDNNELVIKLQSVQIASLDRRIPFESQNRILPLDQFEIAEIQEEAKQQLQKSFVVKRERGRIIELRTDKEQEWVKNVKRGILNLLSVDLNKKGGNTYTSRYCQQPGSKDCNADIQNELVQDGEQMSYRQQEETVEGNCIAQYTIVKDSASQPSKWNITKAIDLSTCESLSGNPNEQNRPKIAYNFHISDSCPGLETQDKAVNASTYMNFDCFGENREDCVIERSSAVSIYTVQGLTDEPGNTIRTKVNQTLILIDVRQEQAPQTSGLQKQQTGLKYSLEWDRVKEEFQLTGKDAEWKELKEYAKWGKNKVKVSMDLLAELGADSRANVKSLPMKMSTAGRFAQLVKVIRGMSEQEIEELHNSAFDGNVPNLDEQNSKAVKDMLHSAVAAAGTLPAVKHIRKNISQNKMNKPIRIASAIKQLQNARFVGQDMTNEMKALCDEVEGNKAYYQLCLLSYGSMIRTRCQPRRNSHALQISKCSSSEKKELVEYFSSKLKDRETDFATRIAAVKGLANTALPEMAPIVQEVARNFENSEEIRTQSILALRSLKEIAPRLASHVSLPVVKDRRFEPSVRVAAAHVVLSSDPEMPDLLTLVSQINRRKDSRIVKSYIYSELSGLANSTSSMSNPCRRASAMRARQALRHVNDNEKVLSGSFVSRFQLFSSRQAYGKELTISSLRSNSSFIPAILAAKIGSSYLGQYVPEAISMSIQSRGLDKLIVNYLQQRKSSAQSRSRRSTLSSAIREKLADISSGEHLQPEDARLVAYLRVMGQEAGALPIDKSIMEYLTTEYEKLTNDQLSQEFSIHLAGIFSESLVKIPTSMGLPILVRSSTPIIFQAKGSLGKHNTDSHWIKNLNIMPTLLAKQEVSVEVFSPVVNSGVKVSQRIRLSLPISGSVDKKGEIDISAPQENTEHELLTVTAEPFAFRRKWYEAEPNTYVHPIGQLITSETHSRVQKLSREYKIFGLKFQLRGQLSSSYVEKSASFPWVPPTAGPSVLSVSVGVSDSSCQEIKIKPSWKSNRVVQGQIKSEVHRISAGEGEQAQEFSAPIHSLKKLTLEAECGSQYKRAEFSYKASPGHRLKRIDARVYNDKSDKPRYCFEVESLYPANPVRAEDLNGKINSRVVYSWGPDCSVDQQERKVKIEVQSEISSEKMAIVRSKLQDYERCVGQDSSPVECYHILSEAQRPDKYMAVVKYSDVPESVRNTTQRLFAMFTAAHILNARVNKYEKAPNDVIRAELRIDPMTSAQQNLTIQEPGQTVQFRDIRSPVLSSPNTQLARLLRPSSYVAKCLVSDRIVKSFDGIELRAPVTDCWTVLAKDCSRASRFAVLMRQKTRDSSKKILGIVTETSLIEIERDQDFKVKIDGSAKELSSQMEEIAGKQVYAKKYNDRKMKLSLPEQEISVYFDGEAASIKISAAYFGQQCGLCGHYSQEAAQVLRSPKGESQSSVLQFFKSYQLNIDGCQEPSDPSRYHLGLEKIGSDAEGSGAHLSRSAEPLNVRRGVFRSGRYCVSSDKIKTCPIGSTPVAASLVEKEFQCIGSSYISHKLAQEISEQQDVEVPSDDVDFSTKVHVDIPTSCQRH